MTAETKEEVIFNIYDKVYIKSFFTGIVIKNNVFDSDGKRLYLVIHDNSTVADLYSSSCLEKL